VFAFLTYGFNILYRCAGGSQIKGKGKRSKKVLELQKPSKASNSSKPKSKSHLIVSFLHL